MRAARLRDLFTPWAGIALGTLGAGLAHEIGAATTFQDCAIGSPWAVIAGALVGMTLIAAGALASWRVFAATREARPRRMIAAVSLMAAAIFAIAILLPLIAALVIPRCWA